MLPAPTDRHPNRRTRARDKRRIQTLHRLFIAEPMEARLLLSGSPTLPPIAGNWSLSLNENFTSIDPSVWSTNYWWGGNSGTQATFDPSALSIGSNGLSITATKQSKTGVNGVTNPYTSGLLSSGGVVGSKAPGFSFTYGYVETTTKVAPGQGMWSALWMLPADHNDNRELDVMENLGRAPFYYNATYHWDGNYFQPPGNVSSDLTAGFHTYGVDWEPDHITWYFDGQPIGTFTNAADISNRPMYLIMNLDVGGPWAGPLNGTSPASSTWQIQDVRVWQHGAGAGDTTPPSTPKGLSDSANATTSTTISWLPSSDDIGVAGYNIFRNGLQVGSVAGDVTSLSDFGLSPATAYSYTVDAFDAAGNVTSLSSPLVVTTKSISNGDTSPPTAPPTVFSSATTAGSVAVSWTSSSDNVGVTGYNVYRNGTKIGTTSGIVTFFVDTGLTPGATYTYTVSAFDLGGNVSALSNPFIVTTSGAAGTGPTAPSSVSSSATTTTSVAVSWIWSTAPLGVAGYTVFRNGQKIGTTPANTTFFVDTGLTPGATYTYTVSAFDTAGNTSVLSAPFTVTTGGGALPGDTTPPTSPTSLFSSATTSTTVAVSWLASTDNVGVTGYNIFRNGVKIGTVAGNVTFLSDTGLVAGTTYTYTVTAFDAAGNTSAPSSPLVVTTSGGTAVTSPVNTAPTSRKKR